MIFSLLKIHEFLMKNIIKDLFKSAIRKMHNEAYRNTIEANC